MLRRNIGSDMSKARALICALVVGVGLASWTPAWGQKKRARPLAILPLQPLGTDPEVAQRLEDLLYAQVAKIRGIRLISRKASGALLQKQSEGCEGSSACMKRLASALKVRWLVHGTVATLGDSYVLDLKLSDGRSGRELRRHSISLSGEQAVLIEGVREVSTQLIAPEQYVGAIELSLDRPGAQIFVDGTLVGTTPIKRLTGLSPGTHALKIVLDGFGDFDRFVDVRFDRVTRVNVALSGTSIDATIEAVAVKNDTSGAVLVEAGASELAPQVVYKKIPLSQQPWLLGGMIGTGAGLCGVIIATALWYQGQVTLYEVENIYGTRGADGGPRVLLATSDQEEQQIAEQRDLGTGLWYAGMATLGLAVPVTLLGAAALIFALTDSDESQERAPAP